MLENYIRKKKKETLIQKGYVRHYINAVFMKSHLMQDFINSYLLKGTL